MHHPSVWFNDSTFYLLQSIVGRIKKPWSHLFSTSLTMHKRGCIKAWNLYWLAWSCVGTHHLKSLDTYTLQDLVISVTSFPHNGQLYSLHQSSSFLPFKNEQNHLMQCAGVMHKLNFHVCEPGCLQFSGVWDIERMLEPHDVFQV